jgi:hypothetical protein
MIVKTFKLKKLRIDAVQYDGTPEMAEDLVANFRNLEYDGCDLYFTGNYLDEAVSENDWILVDDGRAAEIKSNDFIYDYFDEVKP